MTKPTYYDLLGVSRHASTDEIKHAYRKLIRQYHPDTGTADSQMATDINQAYETLKDPSKRANYNKTLKATPTLKTAERLFGNFKNNIKDNVEFIKSTAQKAFHRPNNDEHMTIHVYPWQAIFGDKITIKTNHHHFQVLMPAFDDTLTLKITGAGKPCEAGFGDLYITFAIAMPNLANLNNEQRQAWQQLQQSYQTANKKDPE